MLFVAICAVALPLLFCPLVWAISHVNPQASDWLESSESNLAELIRRLCDFSESVAKFFAWIAVITCVILIGTFFFFKDMVREKIDPSPTPARC